MEETPSYWKHKYQDMQQQYQTLGFQYQEAEQNLKRIRPVYEKFYRSWWWYWIIRPHDPYITGKQLMRCKDCHGIFWKNGKVEMRGAHVGHIFFQVKETSIWEYIRVRLGLVW